MKMKRQIGKNVDGLTMARSLILGVVGTVDMMSSDRVMVKVIVKTQCDASQYQRLILKLVVDGQGIELSRVEVLESVWPLQSFCGLEAE
jgi:hypothetical protein